MFRNGQHPLRPARRARGAVVLPLSFTNGFVAGAQAPESKYLPSIAMGWPVAEDNVLQLVSRMRVRMF